jgi:hypothetical protein
MRNPLGFNRSSEHDTPFWEDVRAVWSSDQPYRWHVLALSLAITGFLVWTFVASGTHRIEYQPPEVTWIKIYPKGRTREDVIRQQAIDGPREIAEAKAERAEREEHMRQARELADALGIDVDD